MKSPETCKSLFMNKFIQDSTIYDEDIRRIAKWLSNGDLFLAEELRSEMHIAVLGMEAGKDKSIYLRVAKFRAIDYLRSRSMNYSYAGVYRHISLEAMERAGFQIDTDMNVYSPNRSNEINLAGSDNFDDSE